MRIDATGMYYRELNDAIRQNGDAEVTVDGCAGQRYIGCASAGRTITIHGTPGNGLGQYLDGTTVVVQGNAQDATGNTMNEGEIRVHGHCGDATGYAMRGGAIYVRDDVGYRAGIHMKAYRDKFPALIIGGRAGSFLGEYQAGGVIAVLNLEEGERSPVGFFPATGMHGGKIFLRAAQPPKGLPAQVMPREATAEDMAELSPYVEHFARVFDRDTAQILDHPFIVLVPNTGNPYRRMYVYN